MNKQRFYRRAESNYTIVDSVRDSIQFTTRRCLTTHNGNLCANSTFVDPNGEPQPWHEFGCLEGVGWAANAVGGAHELLWYADFFDDLRLRAIATSVLYHVLEGGFFQDDGFVLPYRDTTSNKHYLNYLHNEKYDTWFCPGSTAHIGLQLLWASDRVEGQLKQALIEKAVKTSDWLFSRIKPCKNGWYPRRLKRDGTHADHDAQGHEGDPQFDHSGDGTYLLWLWTELTIRGLRDHRQEIERAANVYRDIGGAFGSINADTYDSRENVAYSVGFRCLTRVANFLRDTALYDWTLAQCLHGLERFEMKNDRNKIKTQGLLYMEDSWDTSYLWENAEASLAYLEAAKATRIQSYELKGLTILRTAALHHHGEHGFLTEGVDWNNHNGQWRNVDGKNIPIHIDGATYGDVNYTQPFLNNMHIAAPTLYYLNQLANVDCRDGKPRYYDCEQNVLC